MMLRSFEISRSLLEKENWCQCNLEITIKPTPGLQVIRKWEFREVKLSLKKVYFHSFNIINLC